MHVTSLLTSLALSANTVTAFYGYIPTGENGAKKHVHVSNQISKGFAFAGKEVTMKVNDKLAKSPLRKRARPNRSDRTVAKRGVLEKRLNDFKVATAKEPTEPNSASINQDGTDFSYFSEVTFGSEPGETVYLLLDTGSSATWMMGSDCTDRACISHSHFGPEDSKNLKIEDESFSISYNTGDVSGYIATDSVHFGGMTLQMGFGLANETSSDFDNYPMDGILGLGRTSDNTGFPAPTFMEEVVKEGGLEANVFGIHLDRNSDGNLDGEITFGGPDTSRYSGDLNWIDTDSDIQDWRIPADDILVDGKSVGVNGREAVIDSGTTYMFIPPADADALFSAVEGATPGDDMYHLPCDTTISIALVFGDVAYEISPKDYMGPSIGDGMCYTHIIGVAAAHDDENTWLLGATFLKNVYSVFDMDSNKIGFGIQSSGDSSSEESSSDDAPPKDKPSEDKPSEDKPSEDKPSEDEPSDEEPSDDTSSEDTSPGSPSSKSSGSSTTPPASEKSDGLSDDGDDSTPDSASATEEPATKLSDTESAAAKTGATDAAPSLVSGAGRELRVSMLGLGTVAAAALLMGL